MLAEKARPIYEEEKPRRKIKKKVVRKKKKTKKIGKILYIVFCASVLAVLILRYVGLTKMRAEVTNLESVKLELTKEKTNLEAKLEGIKSSEKISEEAIKKLGMNYPEDGQIAYVAVNEIAPTKDENVGIKENLEKAVNAIQVFLRR